eukprot:scaffold25377_cov53-Attheya_sp.AAC.6
MAPQQWMRCFALLHALIGVSFVGHAFTIQRPTLVRNTRGMYKASSCQQKCEVKTCKGTEHVLFMGGEEPEYSRETRSREEAESPFRKVRFLLYGALLGGAATSLAVSVARMAAGLAGVNTDLIEESVTNAVIDVVGMVVLGLLYKRDMDAQNSRLKRASKGADYARLEIRGSPALLGTAYTASSPSSSSSNGKVTVTASLSSLRRGRGVDKRVVICAGGKEKIMQVLEEVRQLQDSLIASDLVVVPVVIPQWGAPLGFDIMELLEQDCVALPAGGNWKSVVGDEMDQAVDQGINVEIDGFCIVLKKNGRVGQRTKGVPLRRMVGEVEERAEMGMDVNNI